MERNNVFLMISEMEKGVLDSWAYFRYIQYNSDYNKDHLYIDST